jgi:CAF1 family ribonuclease
VQKYLALQVGITTFIWSSMKKKYIGRPFNFMIYPRSLLKERFHHVNSDTMDFLNRFHFDFNKAFRHGIVRIVKSIANLGF